MESFNLDNSQEVPYDLKNLDDTHPKESNVEGLKIQLMNHQKTALYHCLMIESNEGILINSAQFNGVKNKEAIEKIAIYIEENKMGKRTVNYRLKDWLVSRQRYWGTPIPALYCDKCGVVMEKDENLPVRLPNDIEFSGGYIKSEGATPCGKISFTDQLTGNQHHFSRGDIELKFWIRSINLKSDPKTFTIDDVEVMMQHIKKIIEDTTPIDYIQSMRDNESQAKKKEMSKQEVERISEVVFGK